MLENYYLLDTELRYILLFMEILCTETLIFRRSKKYCDPLCKLHGLYFTQAVTVFATNVFPVSLTHPLTNKVFMITLKCIVSTEATALPTSTTQFTATFNANTLLEIIYENLFRGLSYPTETPMHLIREIDLLPPGNEVWGKVICL